MQVGVLLGLSLLTACGGTKDTVKETVTETVAETVTETVAETAMEEIIKTETDETDASLADIEYGTGGVDDSYAGFEGDDEFSYDGEDNADESVAENADENVNMSADPFANINYAIFKAPEEVQVDEGRMVETYGYIYDKDSEYYDIYTANGPFRFQYDKELSLHGCVVVVNTGITTMSYPGIIAQVKEVRDVAVDEVLVEGMSLDDLYLTESQEEVNASLEDNTIETEVQGENVE